jgi:phage I-like protein
MVRPMPNTDHGPIALRPASPAGVRVALHDARADGTIALCQPQPLAVAGDEPPEWVHLIPAGEIVTQDGRGPYRLTDAAAVIRASLAEAGGRLPIDENHATDYQAPKGGPSPARAWIVALEARADGIWGRVEWTRSGRELVTDRAYRALSPAFLHARDGTVLRILRAALTNVPNLRGLAALHQRETAMKEVLDKLKQMLGLDSDADDEKIWRSLQAVIDAAAAEKAKAATALQAALKSIATAAGLKDDADGKAILAAVTQLAAGTDGDKDKSILALQAEVRDLAGKLKAATDETARDKATAAVDAAIADGKPGVRALRDHYIGRHMADPAAVDKELDGLPSLTRPSGASQAPPVATGADGKPVVTLHAAHTAVARLLGTDPEAMKKTLAAEAAAGDEAAA